MENWGLVTYREQSLLYDMSRDRFKRKKYVCTTVSHEMGHMWFGNLVTTNWWAEMWINEGLTQYITYHGMEPSDNPALEWTDDTGVKGIYSTANVLGTKILLQKCQFSLVPVRPLFRIYIVPCITRCIDIFLRLINKSGKRRVLKKYAKFQDMKI